ncbi:rhodanese-like domain-containing protein [Chondrinema litorale]|uniref:rhodanese-like domain-containing protein n=1 Tax=Chondrinema litorale TaxID=2994555 RepID=UPI0025429510|nr:rhodanese-like domain-containing protein [Chondrinema litorale]UZR94212.1 rhodanese-like domain-containing protein [Chondrinema litorale]
MKEITVQELKKLMDDKEDFQLIDVREENEFNFCNINGELMPLGRILDFEEEISKDKKVVVHCRSGARSANAILQLEDAFGYDNLYNLKGGILAYAKEIDPSIPQY